jgi:nitrogen fixation protein FixH
MTDEHASKTHGRRVFWYFIAFFGLFMAVDAVMATLALKTNTGVVTQQPYEEGLAYNRTLEEAQKQADLGWHGIIDYKRGQLTFVLNDASGRPLSGAAVKAKIERPVAEGMDRVVTLTQTGPGRYSAPVTFEKPGKWNVRIFAQWQTHSYQQGQSLMIAP